jgi:hypothetical protein
MNFSAAVTTLYFFKDRNASSATAAVSSFPQVVPSDTISSTTHNKLNESKLAAATNINTVLIVNLITGAVTTQVSLGSSRLLS